MTAAAAPWEALLEMEGQMLRNRAAGGEAGTLAHILIHSLTHSLSLSLQIHVSDTAATSQDGSIFRMQGSEGCETATPS